MIAILGSPTRTNLLLAYAWRRLGIDARVLWPHEALSTLEPGDVALVRLDVLPTLDGIEGGLEVVPALAELGVRVLNQAAALYATHDKLVTALELSAARVPHPWTEHLAPRRPLPALPIPCVLKPRFGSWGEDVFVCRSHEQLATTLELIQHRPWWARQGALAQELVNGPAVDVRVLVAGGTVVAGAQRRAAPGEWRTNVTLGGSVIKAELPPGTKELALRAAAVLGIDFACVDLLPRGEDWTVLELNGAVDFDANYALSGRDPFVAIADALELPRVAATAPALSATNETEVAMPKTVHGEPARPGDEVVITGHSVGDAPKVAVILEVLGVEGREHFLVRWEDGHESIFFPGEDAVVRPSKQAAKPKV